MSSLSSRASTDEPVDLLATDMSSLSPREGTGSTCCHVLAFDDPADVLAPDDRLVLASEGCKVAVR